jgi:hypothetical protein
MLPLAKEHLNADEISRLPGIDEFSIQHDITFSTQHDISIAGNEVKVVRQDVYASDQAVVLIVEDNADMRHYHKIACLASK